MAVEVRIPTILRTYTGGEKAVSAEGVDGRVEVGEDALAGELRHERADGAEGLVVAERRAVGQVGRGGGVPLRLEAAHHVADVVGDAERLVDDEHAAVAHHVTSSSVTTPSTMRNDLSSTSSGSRVETRT